MKISNIKPKFVLFICLFSFQGFTQESQTKDSIIYLNEVSTINRKDITLKTKGHRGETRGFQNKQTQFVTRVDQIPIGELSSLTFYFKTANIRDNLEYELKLLILEVAENGLPGKPLTNEELHFKIKAGKKEKIDLDLKPLSLESVDKLFFGFEIINDVTYLPLIVHFWETKSEVSFSREFGGDWKKPVGYLPQLKMEVAIWPNN